MLFWLTVASGALAVVTEEPEVGGCDWAKCATVAAACADTCLNEGISSQGCKSCMGSSYETCKDCLEETPAPSESDPGAVSATIRDNLVYFVGAADLGWAMSGHSITAGQPWDGVHNCGTNCFDFRAGRKGSSGPAVYFKEGLTPVNWMGLSTVIGIAPAQLNFSVRGELRILIGGTVVSCPDMRLGQGHVNTSNNWWIGGSGCLGQSKANMLRCECGLSFYPGDDDHTFIVATEAEIPAPAVTTISVASY